MTRFIHIVSHACIWILLPLAAFGESIDQLKIKAEEGDIEAQFQLGESFYTGDRVDKDQEEAVNWYRKAADNGHSQAQLKLGTYYLNGGDFEQHPEGWRLIRQSAEQGNLEAQNGLAFLLLILSRSGLYGKTGADYALEAVDWYRKAAEQGDADAQFSLGDCYANGEGVSKDQAEAVNWYRKAADQGHADAQVNLGVFYANGEGVSKDQAEAVKWYRRAAEQGHAGAQFNLGSCYRIGKGVSKNEAEAVNWYRKAADQGDSDAQLNLGVCYILGKGVSKDEAEAVNWFQKAAEQGDAYAQFNLGVCYANGEGVSKEQAEAVKWYRKAAEQGHAGAQVNLGVCYISGKGVSKDEAEAANWFHKAAEQGDAEAQTSLGSMYAAGRGVKIDNGKAIIWLRKAAEQGHETAKNLLNNVLQNNKQSKHALLIANSKYTHFGGLPNTLMDATLLAKVLQKLGFETAVVQDANREEMLEAINLFEIRLKETSGLAFFHYGGHGVQVDGRNYLIPVDADIPDEVRVSTRAVDLNEVMAALESAKPKASIIVLDACRDNPLPGLASRSATRGLAVVNKRPRNSIIIYAAEAGSKAWDGIFTPIFSSAIQLQNISIDRVMKIVRGEVSKNTNGEQIPGEYNQLFEDIYLGGNQEETKLPIIKESPSELKITDELITQFYKALRTDFEKILETTTGQNSQASKQPQPAFSFQWGETFSRVEQSLSNLSKSADIKITGIEYDDQKKFMYVEGIPQKNLHKTIFVFFADKLVGIQLNYSSLNWSEDQFQSFFKQVKENCDSKYGKGVALNKDSKIVNNMVIAYDSIQWAGKNTGVGLFLFSAKENDQKYNTLILRYNKK